MAAITGDELREIFEKVKHSVPGVILFYVKDEKYTREEPNGEMFIQEKIGYSVLKPLDVKIKYSQKVHNFDSDF